MIFLFFARVGSFRFPVRLHPGVQLGIPVRLHPGVQLGIRAL
jgi:hypothetical protein